MILIILVFQTIPVNQGLQDVLEEVVEVSIKDKVISESQETEICDSDNNVLV